MHNKLNGREKYRLHSTSPGVSDVPSVSGDPSRGCLPSVRHPASPSGLSYKRYPGGGGVLGPSVLSMDDGAVGRAEELRLD